MRLKAYEGKEKYIFVSYAHKDSEQVLGILEKMVGHGYRVWYDEGIAPGSEWPENIAQHLNDSAMVMAFVSGNSLASPNCRREITFALSKHKPFLGIVLERAEMSLGMEMQLSAQQCIFRYNYDTEAEFLEKIISCPDLETCKNISIIAVEQEEADISLTEENAEAPKDAPRTAPEATAQAVQSSETKAAGMPAATPKPTPSPARESKPASAPMQTSTPTTAKKPVKTKWLVLAAIVGVLIIGGVAISSVIKANQVQVTINKTVNRKETYLYLAGETITSAVIAEINQLTELEYLTFSRCVFSENAFENWENHAKLKDFTIMGGCEATDYTFLSDQTGLTSLTLENCGVADTNFSLTELSKLTTLNLAGNEAFTDLSLINAQALRTLNISGTGVEDLTPLEGAVIRNIDFSKTAVADVTTLETLKELEQVNGSDTAVSDISALAELSNIKEMYFNRCAITKVTDLFMSLKMERIGFIGNAMTDCSGFDNFTVLKEAYLSGNQLQDVSFLGKNTGTLQVVDLSGNELTGAEIAFLKDCTGVQCLYVDDIAMTDLSIAGSMSDLYDLSAINCGLKSISALINCKKLETVRLSFNELEDISGLENMVHSYQTLLDLGYNRLTDIGALSKGKYDTLILVGNDLDYNSESFTEVTGMEIVVDYDANLAETQLVNGNFSYEYILDCPADKKVAMEKVLGSYTAKFIEKSALKETLAELGVDYGNWLEETE